MNEAPMINEGFTGNSQDEYDTDVATALGVTTAKEVDGYKATDAESADCEACTWSVSGTDAGDFEISVDRGTHLQGSPRL